MTNVEYLTYEDYKQLAKEKWLNAPKIAALLGVSKPSIHKFFQGNYTMSEAKMYKLHNLLTSPVHPYRSMIQYVDNSQAKPIDFLTPIEYKVLAKQRKLSLEALGEHLGCHPTTVHYFFVGKKNMKEKLRKKLHSLLTNPVKVSCKCKMCDQTNELFSINISPVQEENSGNQFQLIVCKTCITKVVNTMDVVPNVDDICPC